MLGISTQHDGALCLPPLAVSTNSAASKRCRIVPPSPEPEPMNPCECQAMHLLRQHSQSQYTCRHIVPPNPTITSHTAHAPGHAAVQANSSASPLALSHHFPKLNPPPPPLHPNAFIRVPGHGIAQVWGCTGLQHGRWRAEAGDAP